MCIVTKTKDHFGSLATKTTELNGNPFRVREIKLRVAGNCTAQLIVVSILCFKTRS